ncbi:unnamed protein product [Spodoptera exigua]|nr:unnamed protein product [Spodoptera exigua]
MTPKPGTTIGDHTKSCSVRESNSRHVIRQPVAKTPHQPNRRHFLSLTTTFCMFMSPPSSAYKCPLLSKGLFSYGEDVQEKASELSSLAGDGESQSGSRACREALVPSSKSRARASERKESDSESDSSFSGVSMALRQKKDRGVFKRPRLEDGREASSNEPEAPAPKIPTAARVIDPGVVKTGAYKYEDGTRYVGEWNSKGQKHGMGHLVLPDGTRYDGALIGGLYSGLGVMAFPDGAKYEGEFMQGWFHGHGVFWRADGMKFEGEFRGGRVWGLDTTDIR